jgi:hypothetical protein
MEQPCPNGYNCGVFTASSWWGCWETLTHARNCYPIADSGYGMSISLINDSDPAGGVFIRYGGHNGIGTVVRVSCDPMFTDVGGLTLGPRATYVSGLTSADYSFTAVSQVVCPRSFVRPVLPTWFPTPSPSPQSSDPDDYRFDFGVDESGFTLDLNSFQSYQQTVVIGSDQSYARIQVHFSAVRRSPAPDGTDLNHFDEANVWQCWSDNSGESQCIPIGDVRYGLEVSAVDPLHLDEGVKVTYAGGVDWYSTTIVFYCNGSLAEDQVVFGPVGEQSYPSTAILINAQTNHVCRGHITLRRDPFTVGAIAVLAVNGIAILYLLFGIIAATVANEAVAFPNAAFWVAFWASFSHPLSRFECAGRQPPTDTGASAQTLL